MKELLNEIKPDDCTRMMAWSDNNIYHEIKLNVKLPRAKILIKHLAPDEMIKANQEKDKKKGKIKISTGEIIRREIEETEIEDFLFRRRDELLKKISAMGIKKIDDLSFECPPDCQNKDAVFLMDTYHKTYDIERDFKAGRFDAAIIAAYYLGKNLASHTCSKYYPLAETGSSFIANNEKLYDDSRKLLKTRKALFDGFTGKAMERYRKIVKIENPNLRSGDKNFKDAVNAMKKSFSEHNLASKKW